MLCGAMLVQSALGIEISLTPSVSGQSPVGAMVTWYGAAKDPSDSLRYRFRVRDTASGSSFRTVRDYSLVSSLEWTAATHEGFYEIELSVRDLASGEIATQTLLYEFVSRLEGGAQAAANPTAHPLVFLFSSAPCPEDSRVAVEFSNTRGGPVTRTPFAVCSPQYSSNFYLAGLEPSTPYRARAILERDGRMESGPDVSFTTGEAPSFTWRQTVIKPAPAGTPNPILLGTSGSGQIAHDLDGKVLWYNRSPVSQLTAVEPGGTFWGYVETMDLTEGEQVIREFDLTGMTVRETNAERVNEQLQALGKRRITTFHHDVKGLPDGRIAALAAVELVLTDIQGPGDVDVIGDMIVVLDRDLNVVWAWDTFDHLDARRTAILGEACKVNGACPNYYLMTDANDWTHGNSVRPTPDGQLLYSTRHQDWLIKIRYDDAKGDGQVLWRLGNLGDFTPESRDPWPWFSHQHDGSFDPDRPNQIIVYDNGNSRTSLFAPGNSRGQVWELNESSRQARLVLNADLGVYSAAVGAGQRLRNGNYHFDSGFVIENGARVSYNSEVDSSGNIVYSVKANSLLYRSYRLVDLYTPR